MRQKAFLLVELVRRDLTSRYAGSFGGLLWALLGPLVLCVLYGVVFGAILRIGPPEGFRGGYALFLLGGLLPWIGFQEGIVRGAVAITDQVHLVKKVSFSVELLVVSTLVSALVLQMVALVPLFGFALVADGPGPAPLVLLAAFAFEVLLLLGPAFALASLNVFFRDVPQLLGPALMVVFYLTPILYPEAQVPEALRPILAVNPLRDLVGLFRAGLFGAAPPPAARLVGWSAAAALVGWGGVAFFRRTRPSFTDLL